MADIHRDRPYPASQTVELREYMEALFREKERALDMAAQERDRAAEVLRDEQRRALLVAETEREKAAAALRAGTDRAIADNYSRLNEKMDSVAELLTSKIEASSTLAQSIQKSAQEAIVKAEEAQQRVNITQNEFRGTLADQASQLMPRKEFETVHAEVVRQVSEVRDSIASIRTDIAVGPAAIPQLLREQSHSSGFTEGKERIIGWIIASAAVCTGTSSLIVYLLTRR
jgi:hypothetical protein